MAKNKKLTRKQKRAKVIIKDISLGVLRKIRTMKMNTAKRCLKRVYDMNSSNCGWYEYWLRVPLIQHLESHIEDLKRARKSKLGH